MKPQGGRQGEFDSRLDGRHINMLQASHDTANTNVFLGQSYEGGQDKDSKTSINNLYKREGHNILNDNEKTVGMLSGSLLSQDMSNNALGENDLVIQS